MALVLQPIAIASTDIAVASNTLTVTSFVADPQCACPGVVRRSTCRPGVVSGPAVMAPNPLTIEPLDDTVTPFSETATGNEGASVAP